MISFRKLPLSCYSEISLIHSHFGKKGLVVRRTEIFSKFFFSPLILPPIPLILPVFRLSYFQAN